MEWHSLPMAERMLKLLEELKLDPTADQRINALTVLQWLRFFMGVFYNELSGECLASFSQLLEGLKQEIHSSSSSEFSIPQIILEQSEGKIH
jgi:hypothetical protein